TVHAGRVRAPFHGALGREALLAFEEQLEPLSAAQSTNWFGVPCHRILLPSDHFPLPAGAESGVLFFSGELRYPLTPLAILCGERSPLTPLAFANQSLAVYTRRFFRGRQPLCGIGVMSVI